MEQRGTDAEGAHGGHGVRRAGKLAVVIAVQNLLVLACLLGLFHIYMELPTMPEDVVHIKFNYLNFDSKGNFSDHFQNPEKSHRMELMDKMIRVECIGPYVWYIHGCEIIRQRENKGEPVALQLRVQGQETPVSSFTLNSTDDCRGLHNITFLKVGDLVSVQLHSESVKIKGMSMGLTYLLGNKCDY